MLNTNGHNKTCAFAEQIVSYLYDEATVKEKTEFVAHLENCPDCSDELTAFGFVRSSIQEWRREEIFALEMPALEIPHLQPVKIAGNSAASENSGSWLDRIQKIFTLSPKLAFGSAAFAVLAICVGLGLTVFKSSNESDVAANSNRSFQNEIANTNKINEPAPTVSAFEPQKSGSVPENKPEQAFIKSSKNQAEKIVESPKRIVKDKPENKKPGGAMASTDVENKRDKTNAVETRKAPKLSNLNEEEDNSLRLADLFSEIDTK